MRIADFLGLDVAGLPPAGRATDGFVAMLLDATKAANQPLTAEDLFRWHQLLLAGATFGPRPPKVGGWREDLEGPMQVISGPIGSERVHFQAPPASVLDAEMARFLQWYNSSTGEDSLLRAALAHLWFMTLHPFNDGNGRTARAFSDRTPNRGDLGEKPYSLSAQIRLDRKAYYEVLETTRRGDLDIAPWMTWFLASIQAALHHAETEMGTSLDKARFWVGPATIHSTNVNSECSANCWTASKAKSPPKNGRNWANALRTRRCATSPPSSDTASCDAKPPTAAAPAMN